MGVWSIQPAGNDYALDWLSGAIESPIIEAIGYALEQFLEDTSSDKWRHEAEIASALLVDLTTMSDTKYIQFNFWDLANRRGLWDKATKAINALRGDEKWTMSWPRPEEKIEVLTRLANEIELAKTPRGAII